MMRIRPLTTLENRALVQAKELLTILEQVQAQGAGSQSDIECIEDALEGMRHFVVQGLEDLGLPEDQCRACQKEITVGSVLCNKCLIKTFSLMRAS